MSSGNRHVFSKALFLTVICAAGLMAGCAKSAVSSLPAEPVKINITAGSGEAAVEYEILPYKWPKKNYYGPDYQEVLFEKLDQGEVNQCYIGDTITFDFGDHKPAALTLQADPYTDKNSSNRPPVIDIPLTDNGFKLFTPYTGYNGNTFFVLTAVWDEGHQAEYVFAVNIGNPPDPYESMLVRYIFTDQGEVRELYQIKEKDGKKGLYTEDGQEEILPCEFEGLMSHYAMVAAQKDGMWQLYDYQGKKLSEDRWEEIIKTDTPMGNDVNGLVAVRKNGVWGCVDQQGKVVIIPNWDAIVLNYYEEVEPYLRVSKSGKYGYLTYDGQTVLNPEYDMVFIDVLNGSLDEIFVRRGDEWGMAKVIDQKAGKVDWSIKPSLSIQVGFMAQRYPSQAQTVNDLLMDPNRGTVNGSVIHFFYEYYRTNNRELFYMPDFNGTDLDWDLFTKFVYTYSYEYRTAEGSEPRAFLTAEEFDRIAGKYFAGISYDHRSSRWLTYSEGKYTPVGWSDHGSISYYLSEIERTKDDAGTYRFQAKLIGYPFWEQDFMEGPDIVSPNMQALKNKARELQYQGKTLLEVRDELMIGDPTAIFIPAVEHTITFTIEDPLGDIYLKYLSASRKELNH